MFLTIYLFGLLVMVVINSYELWNEGAFHFPESRMGGFWDIEIQEFLLRGLTCIMSWVAFCLWAYYESLKWEWPNKTFGELFRKK